jgi:dienelactone hydrolase
VSFDWVDDGVAARGVTERRFDARRAGRVIPGVLWMPEDPPDAPPPLVLMGHGGSAHKRQDYIVGLARRLVRHHGFAAVAIDGPVHGDRRVDPAADIETVNKDFWRTWRDDATMTDERVADWRAVLDAVQDPGCLGAGPVGWWGLSMGTILGLPVVAADSRISVAVLGLMGLTGPTRDRLRDDAAAVRCPVLFLVQWDDELFERQRGLDLFSALATDDKRLHANPGGHVQVPVDEFRATEEFLASHLTVQR